MVRISLQANNNFIRLGVGVRRVEQLRWSSISSAWTVRSDWPIKARVGRSCSSADVTTEHRSTAVRPTLTTTPSARLWWQHYMKRSIWVCGLVFDCSSQTHHFWQLQVASFGTATDWHYGGLARQWTVIPHIFGTVLLPLVVPHRGIFAVKYHAGRRFCEICECTFASQCICHATCTWHYFLYRHT